MTQHGQQDGDQPKFAWRDQYSASSWLWRWFAADEKLIISTVDVGMFFVFFLSCPTNSWEPTFICWPPESCFTILLILKLKPMSAALEHKVLKGEPLPGPFYLRHLDTDELKMQRPHYHHITSWKISFQKKQWKKLKFNRILHCDFCFRFSSAVSNKMRSQLHTLFSSFFLAIIVYYSLSFSPWSNVWLDWIGCLFVLVLLRCFGVGVNISPLPIKSEPPRSQNTDIKHVWYLQSLIRLPAAWRTTATSGRSRLFWRCRWNLHSSSGQLCPISLKLFRTW